MNFSGTQLKTNDVAKIIKASIINKKLRVISIAGYPATGKTTLCLAIRELFIHLRRLSQWVIE